VVLEEMLFRLHFLLKFKDFFFFFFGFDTHLIIFNIFLIFCDFIEKSFLILDPLFYKFDCKRVPMDLYSVCPFTTLLQSALFLIFSNICIFKFYAYLLKLFESYRNHINCFSHMTFKKTVIKDRCH